MTNLEKYCKEIDKYINIYGLSPTCAIYSIMNDISPKKYLETCVPKDLECTKCQKICSEWLQKEYIEYKKVTSPEELKIGDTVYIRMPDFNSSYKYVKVIFLFYYSGYYYSAHDDPAIVGGIIPTIPSENVYIK